MVRGFAVSSFKISNSFQPGAIWFLKILHEMSEYVVILMLFPSFAVFLHNLQIMNLPTFGMDSPSKKREFFTLMCCPRHENAFLRLQLYPIEKKFKSFDKSLVPVQAWMKLFQEMWCNQILDKKLEYNQNSSKFLHFWVNFQIFWNNFKKMLKLKKLGIKTEFGTYVFVVTQISNKKPL